MTPVRRLMLLTLVGDLVVAAFTYWVLGTLVPAVIALAVVWALSFVFIRTLAPR